MKHDEMKMVVLDGHTLNPGDQSWDEVARLGELKVYDRTSPHQLLERASGAQIVLTNKTPIPAEAIAALSKLKFIGVLATGYNVVDTQAAKTRGIPVSNVPEYSTQTVAQFTMALILELSHRVGLHSDSVHRGDWQNSRDFTYWLTPQMELAGKTIGIVGFGKIGRAVGQLAHAFGMNVLAHARRRIDPPAYSSFEWADPQDLFARSDVVTLHCPQTPETTGMVNALLLSKMKRSAFLINTARGGLLIESDLAAALDAATIAGAAVDVVSAEPIHTDNPLLKAKNCLITPHIAWTALEARRRIMTTTAQNIAAFAAGRPVYVVNG
jgi:glycerate dehydrogenase